MGFLRWHSQQLPRAGEVGIKIKHNIPSYVVIRGSRIRVEYPGQPKTCSYCAKYWTTCVGGGKADKCKKNGGQEKPTKVAFRQLISKIKGKEKNGQETSGPLIPKLIPDPDRVSFSGFPENWALKDFKEWLDRSNVSFLEPMLFKSGRPGSFNIASVVEGDTVMKISGAEATEIVEKLNGTQIQFKDGAAMKKRRIRVEAIALSTPKKKAPVVTLDETSTPEENSSIEEIPAPTSTESGGAVGGAAGDGRGGSRGGRGGRGATKARGQGRQTRSKKESGEKEKTPDLAPLPEEEPEMMSDDGELVIKRPNPDAGSEKFQSRQVGQKSAALDSSTSSNGASPESVKNKAGPWLENLNKSTKKRDKKKKKAM